MSFYFYDFETWGADPKRDRPAQFAGIRTDAELNIIGKPDVWYCQLAPDYLPHPQAALITGLTPQLCQQRGLPETEFMGKILERFSEPDSCVLGYNSIRFDDEVTRHSLYRNFYEPYGREWQQGNSRWDLLDVVRACYALRPEGIEWPQKDDGSPSFKLEDLARANQLAHEQAHDALSDVYATIALAKLIRDKQPRMFQFLFEHRKKQALSKYINLANQTPLVHVSGKFPANQGCVSWVVPLAFHPTNKNALIAWNLLADPTPLLEFDSDQLRDKLYTKTADLAEGEERLGLKLIHLNKCPVLAPAKTLSEQRADALGIDRSKCRAHLNLLLANPQVQQKAQQVFAVTEAFPDETNPDYQLYQGFLADADKQKMAELHQLSPQQLEVQAPLFSDDRLNQMLFRYRARNYPASLNEQEMLQWQQYCVDRLTDGLDAPPLTLEAFHQQLELAAQQHQHDERAMRILKALYHYAEQL
ncbi:exodeoxyribonuclease I [Alkalimonas sp.]|uniref:exodeoxyribonuclease I n=1 Tax=Alkalimonas sp. TaxID=1872453 RepID=UPI00263A8055|nr:exodeoxyribonuclease I [Alkalimonas sp.]MCC5824716.1 exodeoxyribonuclease I [Alkalimonas sp.]